MRASVALFSYGRIGVIVPKFGKTVVERNRLRRQLREIARLALLPAIGPCDIVIKALPSAYGAEFRVLSDELAGIAEEIGRNEQ